MRAGWPPAPIIAICGLTLLSAVLQLPANWRSAQRAIADYPPGWEPAAYALALVIAAFFIFTLVGLWRMRRWALLARIAVHIVAPIQMTLTWHESWAQYPLLGPFVSWFWFALLLACTLPYWRRMTWRFP